jgi:hypothetical protein
MESFVCNKCGEDKPLTKEYFYVRKGSKTGFRYDCIPCNLKQKKLYRDKPETKKKQYERGRKWIKENPEWVKSYHKKWEKTHKEERAKRSAERFQIRKDIIAKNKRERYHKDKLFRLHEICRKRLYKFVKGQNKSKSTMDMIGCSLEYLKGYIENQFEEGMTWDNWGPYGWHIDHIIPLSSANNEDELLKLSHYTNLQPLWWRDNLSKGAKII